MLSRSVLSSSVTAMCRIGTVNAPRAIAAFSTVQRTAGDVEPLASFIVSHPHELNPSPLVQGKAKDTIAPAKDVFAVVAMSGKQYKLSKDDVFVTDIIHDVDIGQEITISDVLMVGSKFGTVIGRPVVDGAVVKVSVEELTKDKKVLTLKFRRRKNSRRQRGFRREVAVLRVTDILPPADAKEHLKLQ